MIILAIDTSTPHTCLGLLLADGSIKTSVSQNALSHNEELVSLVNDLLKQHSISPNQLKSIVIGAGPGSFTGLRIGLSFAKGLALGWKIPLQQISSHLALAHTAPSDTQEALIFQDARRGEYFHTHCKMTEDGWRVVAQEILTKERADERIGDRPAGGSTILFSEEGLLAYEPTTESLKRRAEGLCLAASTVTTFDFSLANLSNIQPDYQRAVAAKTIEERKLS